MSSAAALLIVDDGDGFLVMLDGTTVKAPRHFGLLLLLMNGCLWCDNFDMLMARSTKKKYKFFKLFFSKKFV